MSKEQLYSCLVDIRRLQEHPNRLHIEVDKQPPYAFVVRMSVRHKTSSVARYSIGTWTITDCNLSWTESKKSTSNMNNQLSHYLNLVQQLQAQLNVYSFEVTVLGDTLLCRVDTDGSGYFSKECFEFSEMYSQGKNESEYLKLKNLINL